VTLTKIQVSCNDVTESYLILFDHVWYDYGEKRFPKKLHKSRKVRPVSMFLVQTGFDQKVQKLCCLASSVNLFLP
jgi:hypothetical protein